MPARVTADDPLFDTPEAAEYLDTEPTTLENWRCPKRYGIEFIKIGRRVRYRKSALDAWLESRTVRPQQEEAV